MKKLLLALVGVLVFAVPAFAQVFPGQAQQVEETVFWRTYAAAYAAPGFRDSSYVSGTGAISDTSRAFSIDDWIPHRGKAVADTAAAYPIFTFDFFPISNSSPTAVEAGATCVLQVSVDGSNWLAAGSITANELGTSNTFSIPFASRDRTQGTDPLFGNWYGMKLGRIIWTHHSTYVGQFTGRLRGFKLRN